MSDNNFQPLDHLDMVQTSCRRLGSFRCQDDLRASAVKERIRLSTSEASVSRWLSAGPAKPGVFNEMHPHHYIIGIALRSTYATMTIAGHVIHDGRLQAGSIYISTPGQEVHAVLTQPFDFIRLHLDRSFTKSNLPADATLEIPSSARRQGLFRDAGIEALTKSLMLISLSDMMDALYLKGVASAVIARLFVLQATIQLDATDTKFLSSWRLRRAVSFIDAHIAEALSLDALAASVGLSRNYFAAQFRATTGLRPREFLLRRRIERAQHLLITENSNLVQVSLQVGFQTQSHFSTVFKKFVGLPPHEWRETTRLCAAEASPKPIGVIA